MRSFKLQLSCCNPDDMQFIIDTIENYFCESIDIDIEELGRDLYIENPLKRRTYNRRFYVLSERQNRKKYLQIRINT
jgi:hypothetical protein